MHEKNNKEADIRTCFNLSLSKLKNEKSVRKINPMAIVEAKIKIY
jgi:hypothetical protein